MITGQQSFDVRILVRLDIGVIGVSCAVIPRRMLYTTAWLSDGRLCRGARLSLITTAPRRRLHLPQTANTF